MPKTRKILYIDIETSPLDIKTWGVWDQNALTVTEEWVVLGAAYAWDDGAVKAIYPKETANWKEDREGHEVAVLDEVWKLLDEALVVVAHNGDKFDLRKLNARFIRAGFGPPSPYLTIDTLKVAKGSFAFTYNRLDYLGRYLGLGGKLEHEGLDLWLNCVEGDAKAWRTMKRYNKQDVELLRKVYRILRPWVKHHPVLHREGCPTCGSLDRQKRGVRDLKSGTAYQQYSCNTCGSYYREPTRNEAAEYRT